jgi:fucose permease
LIWIYSVGMLAFASLTSVLALFLGARFNVNATTIGPFFLYIGGLSVVMRTIFLGPIVERIGETWAMRVGATLLVIGLLLYPLASSILVLALIMPLVPIGTALLFPATTALMTRGADREETGTVMGVAQTFGGISRVAAPLMATAAFEINIWFPFVLAAAVVCIVTVMAFRVQVVPPRKKASHA